MKTGKVVVVCQWDDQAMYINGRLLMGGDNKLVNGAIEALKRLKIHICYKRINYDIWEQMEGWPKKLSAVPDLVNGLSILS